MSSPRDLNARAPRPLADAAFVTEERDRGVPLDRFLRGKTGASWADVRRAIDTGKVRVGKVVASDGARRLIPGEHVELAMRAPRRETALRQSLEKDLIVWSDASVVVVRKPSGLMTVPFEGEDAPSLDAVVRDLLARRRHLRGRPPLGVVHRLDKATSGLVVFACSVAAKQHLAQQFRAHTIHRRYLAIAAGDVPARRIESRLDADRGDGLRGSVERGGQRAITHVEPLERGLRAPSPAGGARDATLVACRLETGRTHQIRIHLSEAGHPILGDAVYGPDVVDRAPRLMLHAAELGFEHPADGRPMRFEEPPPEDFLTVLRQLGGHPEQLRPRGSEGTTRARPADRPDR